MSGLKLALVAAAMLGCLPLVADPAAAQQITAAAPSRR